MRKYTNANTMQHRTSTAVAVTPPATPPAMTPAETPLSEKMTGKNVIDEKSVNHAFLLKGRLYLSYRVLMGRIKSA